MIEFFLERAAEILFFWGVFLLAPLLIDLSTAVVHLSAVFLHFAPSRKKEPEEDAIPNPPFISIIVPVYNSSATLYRCLDSIIHQTYPQNRMEIICVDNGSTDGSFEVYKKFQLDHPGAVISWFSLSRPCKSSALNAGFSISRGAYLVNVDSDARLEKGAVKKMIAAFEKDPLLVAATGEIRIDKDLGAGKNLTDIIHYCEVLEYLVAFSIGRRFQTLTNSVFTLSGALTAFRREALFCSYMYSSRTLSEDTDLSYRLREAQKKGCRLGCVAGAVAYVEPVSSLDRLYSQRVRWQRGELEVASLYRWDTGFFKALTRFTGRILISDHTLSLSRLTWTFLIPFLYLLGYPLPLVMAALVGLYACYLVLDFIYYLAACRYVTPDYRQELKKIWWTVFFLPVFRWTVYWFRLAGIVLALQEPGVWKAENPLRKAKEALQEVVKKTSKIVLKNCLIKSRIS
jgi:putative glycosyltransferase (exosortase G-associated)